jgi:hypothetical protein
MPISTLVTEYLDEAKSNLRSALVSAARNENPDVVIYISNIIKEIDDLEKIQNQKELQQKFQDQLMKKILDGGI